MMGAYREPRTVPAILRALNEAAGNNPRLRALVDYKRRCDDWQRRLEAACLSVKRCEAVGRTTTQSKPWATSSGSSVAGP